MIDAYKNDLMHIQNELLGDLKNVENKMISKVKELSQSFENQNALFTKKLEKLENEYSTLFKQAQSVKTDKDSKENEILSKIDTLNNKIEENISSFDIKYNKLKKDLSDSNYKFDKALIDNFQIPGIVGTSAPFRNMRDFLEIMYKKQNDFINAKDQQNTSLKKYKEKLESLISANKTQNSLLDVQISRKCELQIKDLEKRFNERIDLIEERINKMRIENGKYSYDLLEQCKDLNNKCNNINDELKSSLDEYNGEFKKYKDSFKEMNNKLNNFEDQYKLFENKLKEINEKFEHFIKLETKIKEFDKNILFHIEKNKNIDTRRSIYDSIEKNENFNLSKSNFQDINFDENEKNSFFSSQKLEHNKNLSAINFSKRNISQISDDKEEKIKVNNILFDNEFFKSPKYSGGSLNKDNDFNNSKIKKVKRAFYKIRSGKIYNRYPFINYDMNSVHENNKKNSSRKNYEKIELKNNVNENEKNDDLKLTNIRDIKNKKIKKDSTESVSYSNHNYKYLDKKIDLLGKTLIDNINKIILQINLIKKKDNNNEKKKYINSKNSKEKNSDENNTLIQSIKNKNSRNSFIAKKHQPLTFKKSNNLSYKRIQDQKVKSEQKLKFIIKDNQKN